MTKKQGEEFDAFQARVKERDTMMEEQRKRKKDIRKVVQLVADPTCDCLTLYALCDDGSMWEGNPGHHDEWSRIADIPQD